MQRTQLEEAFPSQLLRRTALVSQIDVLGDAEAGHEVVRDGDGVGEFGLADDFFCSRLVEEEEVDD